MTTNHKVKGDAFAAIHASASALRRIGAVGKASMRWFDESCLSVAASVKRQQVPVSPRNIMNMNRK
jgi:putative transcriptional regulator